MVPCFRAVLEASWQGSLAILLVWLVRTALGVRVPARWRHALWLLVLVRLLVPAFALPRSPASLQNVAAFNRPVQQARRLFGPAGADGVAAGNAPGAFALTGLRSLSQASGDAPSQESAAGATLPAPGGFPWRLAAEIWLSGMLVCGGWTVAGVFWWQRRLRHHSAPADPAVERSWQECCARTALRFPPALCVTGLVDSPALVGWRRPRLLIPVRTPASFTGQDWDHVFLHEIAHLRRLDHWTQAVQLLALCVHWFNPLVWVSARALRVDRELATDEHALRWVRHENALAYAETLFKTLSIVRARPAPALALVMGVMEEGFPQMRQRLQRIVATGPGRAWGGSVLGVGVLVLLSAVVLGQQAAPAPSAADLTLYADLTPAETLYAAARRDDQPVMLKMLDAGVDPNTVGDTRREHTALTAAATEHHLDALRLLVARGARINDPQPGEPSPALSAALRNGWTDCADYLIGQGAQGDPRVLAAARGDQAVIDDWLAGENLDFKLLQSAVEVAAPNGQTQIFGQLYDAITALPGHQNWTVDNNVTMRTVARGQRAVMEELMRRDPDMSQGVLRLSTSAAQSPGMRAWLNDHGRDVPEASDDERLIENSEHGNLPEMRELLARKGVDVNHRGESGWTPLTKASITGRSKGVKLLLAHGADPNLVRFPGTADYTPLSFAANPATADALLAGGADLHGKTFNATGNAMSYDLAIGGTTMVKYFTDHGLLPGQTDADQPPTLFAATTAETAETLLAHGADVNARDERGDSVLMHAVTQNYQPAAVVRVLLQHGADPNFYSSYWKCTPIAKANDPDTVDALAEGGADLHARDEYGFSPLAAITTTRDDAARCEALMRHGLKIDVEKEGGRLMWLATARDQLGWVKLLLDHGVSANAVWYDEPGHQPQGTPLGAATSSGRTAMAKLLLDHGADPGGGEMAFAMSNGHRDTARMMWERGIRTSSELAYAVSQGAPVEQLARIIASGVPLDPPQDQSFTPLNLAVSLGNLEAVEFLASRGANLGNTLANAVQNGRDQIVEYLLGRGEKPSPGLMNILGMNSHPYPTEPPEKNFNRSAEMLIKAGALDNVSADEAVGILEATTFTRNPGGNPVVLKMLFDRGLRVDTPSTSVGGFSPRDSDIDGKSRSLLDAVAVNAKLPDGGWHVSPETLRVIDEAKRTESSGP